MTILRELRPIACRLAARHGSAIDRLRSTIACLTLTALAATLCGLFLHPHAFLVAEGVLLVAAFGLAWPWITLRDVVDAILYLLRTGCQWRHLPIDFPPKSTVWLYFDQWRHDGTLDTVHDALRREVRTAEKPYRPRTTASVDSQSVDTSSGGEPRGRDNAKNVDGQKRQIIVTAWACCRPSW